MEEGTAVGVAAVGVDRTGWGGAGPPAGFWIS